MRFVCTVIMIITVAGLLMGCTTSKYNAKIEELEGTVKKQDEEIMQLRTTLTKQQGAIGQQKSEPTIQKKENPVAKAVLKERSGLYSYAVYDGGEVIKIYIGEFLDIISFMAGRPDKLAREDLDIFLVESGHKTGTIEYYGLDAKNNPTKLFSITGSLSSAETVSY